MKVPSLLAGLALGAAACSASPPPAPRTAAKAPSASNAAPSPCERARALRLLARARVAEARYRGALARLDRANELCPGEGALWWREEITALAGVGKSEQARRLGAEALASPSVPEGAREAARRADEIERERGLGRGSAEEAEKLEQRARGLPCAQALPLFEKAWALSPPRPRALLGAAACEPDERSARTLALRAGVELEAELEGPLSLGFVRQSDPLGRPPLWSRDGARLVGGEEGDVVILDDATMRERLRISGGEGGFASFSLSHDGSRLLTASGVAEAVTLRVWSAETGVELAALPALPLTLPDSGAPPALFSGDDRTLVLVQTGGKPGEMTVVDSVLPNPLATLVLWDLARGAVRARVAAPVQKRDEEAPRVASLTLAPDGDTLAVSWTNGALELVALSSGEVVGALPRGEPNLPRLAFSADGRLLAATAEGSALVLWDLPRRRLRLKLTSSPCSVVPSLSISPGGRRVALSGNQMVCIHDTQTGALVRRLQSPPRPRGRRPPRSADEPEVGGLWQPEGWVGERGLFTSSGFPFLRLWDVSRGGESKDYATAAGAALTRALLAAPDGASWVVGERGELVRVDPELKVSAHTREDFDGTIVKASLASGGSRLVAFDPLMVFDLPSGALRAAFPGVSAAHQPTAIHPTRPRVAISDGTGTSVWDFEAHRQLLSAPLPPRTPGWVSFASKGRGLLVGSDDGLLVSWDLDEGRPSGEASAPTPVLAAQGAGGDWFVARKIGAPGPAFAAAPPTPPAPFACGGGDAEQAALSDDGRRVALLRKGLLSVCRADTGEPLPTPPDLPAPVAAFAFAPGGRKLAVGWPAAAAVIDLESGERVALSGDAGASRLAFAGRDLLAGLSTDGATVTLWDARSGAPRAAFPSPDSRARALALSPDGARLAVVSQEGELRIWDTAAKTSRIALALGKRGRGLSFSADGRLLAAGMDLSTALIDVARGEIVARLVAFGSGRAAALTPDGAEVFGDPRDSSLRCRVGERVVPFAACEAALVEPGQLAEALAELAAP